MVGSWHRRMPPQCAALPLVVNSLFGVSSGAASRTSLINIGERSCLGTPARARHQPLTGASYEAGETESNRWQCLYLIGARSHSCPVRRNARDISCSRSGRWSIGWCPLPSGSRTERWRRARCSRWSSRSIRVPGRRVWPWPEWNPRRQGRFITCCTWPSLNTAVRRSTRRCNNAQAIAAAAGAPI